MDIQPIVIGTAGHIDHGKSTLVEALSGTDPDRLKEEKERGLTIDLGFARLELADGRQVGIVDVPGHERFVRNMVAGATGIDLVILVVAADDGVMPQTREHLAIMQLLGVERGLIALTKIDVVEPDLVDLAEEDVRECVTGTFLEEAPVMRVSAITGEGIDALRERLFELAGAATPRSAEGVFRMPVQRVFSARGFGTILTGIPVSGRIRVGDQVEVLPAGEKGKVRGIQAYHATAEEARAGHSTALNLADVDHHHVERGQVVVAPGFFKPVRMVGAHLSALPDLDRAITNRMPVRVHTGTADALGEVVLLDSEALAPGETGLVQFRLEQPLVCAPGDRFVLRLASPVITLGGGVVLEESRYRLKRFKHFVIDELERQAQSLGSPAALLEAQLARAKERWLSVEGVAFEIKRSRADTAELLAGLQDAGRVVALGSGARWIHVESLKVSLEEVVDAAGAWFQENPLRELVDVRELRRRTGFDASFLAALLEEADRAGTLRREPGGLVRSLERTVDTDPETARLAEGVVGALRDARFQPPTAAELASALSASEERLGQVLELLIDRGRVDRIGSALFLARESVEEARTAIEENCQTHGALDIPSLRDRLGTSRKFLIPLLEYFDAQGLTLRQAGRRVLKRR